MSKSVLQGVEAVSALDQCRQFLGTLAPKDGSRELWIKQGNKIFYRAQWHPDGSLTGTETHLTDEKDTGSRVDKGKPITDLFERLSQRCQREDGGVFYIPTQPQGLPTADSVDSADDIGIEIDHMPTTAEQVLLYQKFTEVTGLEFASILTSGGTSIHAHLKLDHHAEISGMTYWRRLATIAFGSDPVTVRPAQAMRMPGFYRREKAAYQELLSTSEARYGFAALTEGFRAWFKHNGWSCPRDIGEQWWREVWQPMLRNTTLSAATRATLTAQYLAEGETAYLERRRAESAARERPAMPANGDLKEALRVANDRATVGDFEGVDWDGHGGHARGQCPFHTGKTRKSAWLSDQNGALKFHCVRCTDDEPRDLFEYWCARKGISFIGDSNPLKGREWAESARGFLGWPDLPKKTTNAEAGRDPSREFNEPEPVDKVASLVAEFEEVKGKYAQAQERVESLTAAWETATGDEKKALKEQLRNAKDILKSLNSTRYAARVELNKASASMKGKAETGFAKDYEAIHGFFDGRFSFNLLRNKILLDGEPVDISQTASFLVEATGGYANWHKSNKELQSIIVTFAKKNVFCPIQQYLDGLEEVGHSYLEDVARYALGLTSDVQIQCFKAQLIGSVKRIYEPGCIHRLMPIIYSAKQLQGKSKFIRELYGSEFFGEGKLPMSDKDGQMIFKYSWAHEIGECDTMFRTRESSELKDFVSRTADTFRVPYGADVDQFPRRSVLWGTTNHKVFLTDTTGNSRYPVLMVPNGFKVKADWIGEVRDKVWGAALNAYRAGISNQLPEDLLFAAEEEALEFCEEDVLTTPISTYLANQIQVTLWEVAKALGFDADHISMPDQRRIGKIMSAIGWEKKRVMAGTSKITCWVKSEVL
jgi:hypothetical protein